jgi:hypothetical protein
MAKEKTSDRWGGAVESLSEVQITVTVIPRDRSHPCRKRLATIGVLASARTLLALALAVAVLGAIIAGVLQGDRTRMITGDRAARAHRVEPAAVAAAYGYPFRCLSITISTSNPAYARAQVNRRSMCARYHGYVNASFHRIAGVWRLVLDEGQLFVPNALTRCRRSRTGCVPEQGSPRPRR